MPSQFLPGSRATANLPSRNSRSPSEKVIRWNPSAPVLAGPPRDPETVKLTGVLGRLEQWRRRFEQPRDPRSLGLFRRLVREALPCRAMCTLGMGIETGSHQWTALGLKAPAQT